MSLPAARFFVKAKLPYIFIPKGGKKIAARIARDFVVFLEGFVSKFNEIYNTQYDPAEGLLVLLNTNVDPSALFSEYRELAEKARPAFAAWQGQDGFEQGWKWMTSEFVDWFIAVVVPRPCKIDEWGTTYSGAPWLTKVITEHPYGRTFMMGFVAELRKFFWPDSPSMPTASDTRTPQ